MSCLIDTQVLIWSLISPSRLSSTTRHTLQNETIYVSVISLFEIAIKQKIGKLPDLPVTTNELVEQIKRDGFDLLSLTTHHIACYDTISLHPDHRDPFDRMLLAIALSEQIAISSADGDFEKYTDIVELIRA